MSDYKSIEEYPDFSFVDDMQLEDAVNQMLTWYQEKYEELTGDKIVLQDGDPEKLRMETIGYMYYQVLMYLDFIGKQNTLKYSVDEFLDAIGATQGLQRKEATAAQCRIRFQLSEYKNEIYIIPKGTRCTSGNDVFFYTSEDTTIPIGNISADIMCYCTTLGEEGNDYEIGEIDTLVDTLPYIERIHNIENPYNGTDAETDDEFAERIFLHPASYSTAGTEDSYIYHVKESNPAIEDVEVTSPEWCCTTIRFTMQGGELPNEEVIRQTKEYMEDKKRKVLGDKLTVEAPVVVPYDINFTYYIAESNRKIQTSIVSAVNEAVESYKLWQSEKISRDINPDNLTELVRKAGAKRLMITSPVYTKISPGELPKAQNVTVTFGGIESD